MSSAEKYDVLVLGSGAGGKLIGWTLAKEGKRTAVVERKLIGGSCPNVACLPSKNVIHSAKVASLLERQREFGLETDRSLCMRAKERWWMRSSMSIWIDITHLEAS